MKNRYSWFSFRRWPNGDVSIGMLGWHFVNLPRCRQRWIERRPLPWARFGLPAAKYRRINF